MNLTKTHKVIISILIAVLLVGAYITLDKRSKMTPENTQNNPVTTGTTGDTSTSTGTTSLGNGVVVNNVPGYTIKRVDSAPVSAPKPIPDLTRKVTFAAGVSLSPEAKTVVVSKITSLQALLTKTPTDVQSWIYLGLYQKMAGDYDGARISWQYAGKLSPTDYVSVGNLADLYAYYLKGTAQAEVYFNKAISKGPTQSYLYIQFATFYKDVEKDTTKAKAIIAQGLNKIPNDKGLLEFQANLK